MAGKPGEKAVRAMLAVIDDGLPAMVAAGRLGMSPTSFYASRIYKSWLDAAGDPIKIAELRAELMQRKKELAAIARRRGKPIRKGCA